ncbi:hypothetical protein A3C59_03565 [Candidatus Daviesbacteria bacterium RIFCSPHIGHO2_02_FULL_36_13]|uniref:Single-stranded DNA-binding protein n=1 Tax=Candidatus Daviesbacteria bacterium RIFCSPHIGHO2_02_FULL_36_13 TaxID=1797768 RepID=A0A1F5JQA3_9BACT|nr:MAG: hypothetical protein A3C59_03565 [Candidatus Daviesbacteria bacterium RIFCSPHIGHO2_02_FULL_36_13]OGE43729.1 MAG: hypothetical protein A3A45_02465 [Candidatus Daviesbacteria bacterium RIFCSPLOWO2_01_FULL_36_8]
MASRSWNRVELIGNLTRDPELRYTPNGAAVCTFGLATNRTYVTDGEKKEEVDFHRLVAWNKLAELCNQLLKKGTKAFLSGRLQTRSWEGQDGQTRNVTEIVVEDMIVLSPKTGDYQPAVAEDVPVPTEAPEQPVVEEAPVPIHPSDGGKKVEKEEVSKAPAEDVKDDDLPF